MTASSSMTLSPNGDCELNRIQSKHARDTKRRKWAPEKLMTRPILFCFPSHSRGRPQNHFCLPPDLGTERAVFVRLKGGKGTFSAFMALGLGTRAPRASAKNLFFADGHTFAVKIVGRPVSFYQMPAERSRAEKKGAGSQGK